MPGLTGMLYHNMMNAKWIIGGVAATHMFYWYFMMKPRLNAEVFGYDGNGGKMLKIITDLTDEEMARLKYVRRLAWHWKGSRQTSYGRDNIND